MRITTKPQTWIPVLAFFVMLFGIGTSGYLLYERLGREIEHMVQEGLSAVAYLKASQIVRWLGEQEKDADAISRNNLLVDNVERWFAQGAPGGELAEKLRTRLASLRQINLYESVVLLDAQARPRIEEGLNFGAHDVDLALEAMRANAVMRSDIHFSAEHTPELDLVVPLAVQDTAGPRIIGAVYLRIDSNQFFAPFLQSWPTPSPSGETLLVRRDGDDVLFLTELRHRKGSALKLRLPIDQPLLPAAMALRGETGVTEGVDYRGVPVLTAALRVTGTSWMLVVKQDRAEVEGPLRRLAATAGGLTALLIILASVIASLWWRKQRAQQLAALYEEELKRQALAQHFDYATKYARDVILLFDKTGRLVECSDSALATYGYTRDELLQLTLSELRAAEAVAAIPGDLERAQRVAAGINYETVHRRKDGRTFPVEVSMRQIEIEGQWFYQGIVRDITVRKQEEEALQESEQKLATITTSAQDAIMMINDEGKIVFWNLAAEKMFGYSQEQVIGKELHSSLAPARFQEASREGLRQFIATGEGPVVGKTTELAALRKDGTEFPIELSLSAIKLKDKWNAVGIVRDITERKQEEEALQESEEKYRALFETSQDAIMTLEPPSWKFTSGNPATVTMFGAKNEEEFISHGPWELSPERQPDGRISAEKSKEMIETAMREGSHFFEWTHRRIGGEEVPATVLLSRMQSAGKVFLQATVRDITEHKRAEESLHLQSSALQAAVNAIIITDKDGNIQWVNSAFTQLTGYSPEEAIGKNSRQLVKSGQQDQVFYKNLWDTILSGNIWQGEMINRRKDGSLYSEDQSISPVLNDRGEITHFIAIKQDITERKETQDKILRLNRVYQMQSAINTLIIHVQERQVLLNEACRIAIEDGQFRMAWIGLLPAGEKVMVPLAWAGHEEGFLQHVHVSIEEDDPSKDSASNTALRTLQPTFYNHLAEDEAGISWKDEATARGYHAVAGLPLSVEGEVMGVISLYAAEAGFFDAEEMKLLTEFSGDISYALQNLAQEERLDYLASYDPLTGLANRNLFYEHLNSVLGRAAQSDKKVALLVCDLKQFRHINSVYGRAAGDQVLQETARRLHELTSDPVNIARIGGDYFALILHDVGDATGLGHLFEHSLFPALNQSFFLNDCEIQLNFCGGIAVYPADGTDAEALYRNAEAALKKAKGLNESYMFYQVEMTARIAEILEMEHKLRTALKEEQFVLHYQPKVDAQTRTITGLEALIRWQDPDTGLVPPMKFIPILEESGLILEVGLWALDQAASDYRQWQKLFKTVPRIAVNVSAPQLRQKDFVAQVEQAIRRSGEAVPMDIELTESLVMTDIEDNIRKLQALRGAGLEISIDDFGTGYSSLSYIAKLPIDSLKVDRSFINHMTENTDSMSIVSAIITLAHALHFKVIAEGVETEEQAKLLTLLRCNEMQGFLFSKPLSAAEMTDMLRSGKSF